MGLILDSKGAFPYSFHQKKARNKLILKFRPFKCLADQINQRDLYKNGPYNE
jgi:hypothetical protein